MADMEFEAIINGGNKVSLEGYVTNMKFIEAKKLLLYNLVHISTSVKTPDKYFDMPIAVEHHNNGAVVLSNRTREAMYVEVEGKLRSEETTLDIEALYKKGIKKFTFTTFKIIGTHIVGKEQVKANIKIKDTKGDTNAG